MRSQTLLFGFTSFISQLSHSFAAGQQLPHEVYNVTAVEPPSLLLATVNFTITDTVTATTTETTTETTTLPPPPPPVSTLTVIYPSSDAAPVEVTSISQVVTSFIPEATFCVGPALFFSSIEGGPFYNGSANVTQVIAGTSSCGVEYSTTTKTICATTLTGIASKITVSECDQEVTFSSECGYTLETPSPTPASNTACPLITPAPTVRRLMTYWLAPWQSLTAGGEPPSDVDVKVCTELDNGTQSCQRYQEVWEIVVVTSTLTTSVPVTFSKTVAGPGALIFDSSTSYINSTTEFVSLSKTLRLETEVTVESTSTGPRPTATVQLTQQYTSTLTVTRHLEHVSSTPVPEPSSTSTSTSTNTSTPSPAASSTPSSTPSSAIPDSTSAVESSTQPPAASSSTSSAAPTTTVTITSFSTKFRTSTVTKPRSRPLSSGLSVSV